ncbi:MAG: glutamine-hydrolyzing carbamoyl-phosphate synthase small subunit [Alkalispirochaeta sp.]
MDNQTSAVLVLADGRVFSGVAFGASLLSPEQALAALDGGDASSYLAYFGEVVFNTAMSGYPEVLTDPSYTGQIVAMTYPQIGNYGIDAVWSESGPEEGRTRLVKVAGLVVRELYEGPVHPGRISLDAYLRENGIPAITGIDTRALTLHLRKNGSQNAVICGAADGGEEALYQELSSRLSRFPAMEGRGLLGEVGTTTLVELAAPDASDAPDGRDSSDARDSREGASAHHPGPHLALYDCGAKANIVRELRALGCRLSILPSTATAQEIRDTGAEAVLLSNGPGDPAVLTHQVAQTRELLGEMPVLGICLGHQIIAEAVGGRTSKMKFGHHGVNHPVRDEITRRVFVTSQNHGFTVEEESLPPGMDVWFRNANDGSVEGLRDEARAIRTTQFHPESAPGPADSRWIFAAFLEAIRGYGGGAVAGPDEPTGDAKRPAGPPGSTRKGDR